MGERLYRIDDDGFYVKTDVSKTVLKWSSILDVINNKTVLMVKLFSNRFVLIPKNNNDNKDKYLAFEAELRKRIGIK